MIETVPSGTLLHGRYRVERVLGSGGFGHVYLAIDTHTNTQCAVKEYLVTGANGQEQLKHEAAVLSHIHHPNIPAFLDAFMEKGRYHVVLKYIEGRDLTDHLRIARQRNEPIPLIKIITWTLAICDAVMFLHSQRPAIIHRDIKPDNIRITSNGTAILVDLGNAKASADGSRTLLFIRHQGTPGYAPPEQYPGGSGTDTRSDIYALGATLFFALTGQEPPSVSARNQSIQQRKPDLPTLQEILARNPPEIDPKEKENRQFKLGVSKPSKPSPRYSRHVAQLGTLPPECLEQLNNVIHRAMAMKPRERYQYIADFANDLKKVMAALPISLEISTVPKQETSSKQIPIEPQRKFEVGSGATKETASEKVSSDYCPSCQALLTPQAPFCPRCGTPQKNTQKSPQTRDISAEETLLVKKERTPNFPTTYNHPSHQSAGSSYSSSKRAGTSQQQTTVTPPPSKLPQDQWPPVITPSSQPLFHPKRNDVLGSLMNTKFILLCIVAICIIVGVLLFVLALSKGHHSSIFPQQLAYLRDSLIAHSSY